MEFILMRHGIAVEPEEWQGEEALRPLTEKGRAKTREAAEGLAALGIKPTALLSSPFTRAHETAEIVHQALGCKRAIQICDELTPDRKPEDVLALLEKLGKKTCVVCVGHEPLLGALAGLFLFGKSTTNLAFRKAGACCITFDDVPMSGKGQLDWWLRPSILRSLKDV
ncbi:MAG: phosphohistidine phosphatase SixA [Nitrospiraceae bacterium]